MAGLNSLPVGLLEARRSRRFLGRNSQSVTCRISQDLGRIISYLLTLGRKGISSLCEPKQLH